MNNIFTHLLALSGLLALLVLYSLWRKSPQNPKVNSAPEPSGAWPVIGHLHLLGGRVPVYRTLGGLADRYGPVFTVRLGVHTALVVSSWEAVKDCFTTNDKILNKRPASSAGKYLGYDYAAFGFSHGTYWRQMRKLVLLEVLSARRLESLKNVWESEIHTSINELYKKHSGKVVVISEWIERLTLNTIVMMIAGKRYTDSTQGDETVEARSFRELIKEFMYISGQFVASDAIPFPPLRWMDFQGHIKSMKRISKELSTVFERWITEHVRSDCKSRLGNEQDFIDVMLSTIDEKFTSFGHTRETIIKATALNLILAGSDTTSIHLTWLLSLLLNNRQVMQQAQEEIDMKVGKERWVQESDIKNLVYLQAVVKETLRLFPPGPLSVPHEAMEDCCVAGYHVPKGTRLLVNVWKLHRDPRIWAEPDNFVPERFLTSHVAVDFTGQNHEFVPFGSGRRSCPGITFAMQVTHLTLARLLQGFDLATPSNGPVDMTEGLSITLPKATPLEVVITPRLSDGLYQHRG
ncbi:UNVERIFIED_CONTAM: Xanthotoxin 5-hydroxylase CYP82C2 [Sesamum indicum]